MLGGNKAEVRLLQPAQTEVVSGARQATWPSGSQVIRLACFYMHVACCCRRLGERRC